MSNFSKSFGLTFINDDHFFSRVAIFQGFSNGLCRIVWGYSYDKIGFKKCFIIIGSAVTLGTTILPLLPLLGHTVPAQAGYASVMVLLYGAFPGIYAIVAAAVADAFGHLHYKANFGLLFTQAVAYSAALLVATQVMPPPERERSINISADSSHSPGSGIHRYLLGGRGLWRARSHQQLLRPRRLVFSEEEGEIS